jgi:hypothetical protein
MNHLKMIHEYLEKKAPLDSIPRTGLPFVTISRQAGAGGHLLAHVLQTDFLNEKDRGLFRGWHVFDRELCEIVAQDPELKTSMEALLAENYRSEFQDFLDSLFLGRSEQYALYKKTFHIVRILALLGKVIIVGRGSAMVTRDIPGAINVRLVAPEASRVRWMMKKLKLDRPAALKTVRKQDADRRRMVKTFFQKDIDDPLLYDAVWNSETVNPHEMAHAIIGMLNHRFGGKVKGE